MLAGTMMAGPDDQMATETAFLQALQGVSGWRMNKADLELLKGEQVVLRFTVGAAAK
jgi:heat shock protein HslJ